MTVTTWTRYHQRARLRPSRTSIWWNSASASPSNSSARPGLATHANKNVKPPGGAFQAGRCSVSILRRRDLSSVRKKVLVVMYKVAFSDELTLSAKTRWFALTNFSTASREVFSSASISSGLWAIALTPRRTETSLLQTYAETACSLLSIRSDFVQTFPPAAPFLGGFPHFDDTNPLSSRRLRLV